MITGDQIKNLADIFQIDKFTILREYLQLLFLSYLYQEREAGKIFFKGGTALRLLFGSPRFSEDLDFSTTYSNKEIEELLEKLEKKLVREVSELKISRLYSGKEGIRFRVKYEISDFKYPLNIRLDFHRTNEIGNTQISTLSTPFPVMIFPQVFHLTAEEILKEKLAAIQTRRKGRDLFDIWFLLSRGIKFCYAENARDNITKRIKNFPETQLGRDLEKFLPKNQRTIIANLKKELFRLI